MVKKVTVFTLCVWGIVLFAACRLYLKIPLKVFPGDEMLRYSFFANITSLSVTIGVFLPLIGEFVHIRRMTVWRTLCCYREYLSVTHLFIIVLVGLTQQVIRHAWSFPLQMLFNTLFIAGCMVAFSFARLHEG